MRSAVEEGRPAFLGALLTPAGGIQTKSPQNQDKRRVWDNVAHGGGGMRADMGVGVTKKDLSINTTERQHVDSVCESFEQKLRKAKDRKLGGQRPTVDCQFIY